MSVERAKTIPAAWYSSAEIAERERAEVFHASWQLVARADQLRAPGSYVSTVVAGEPVVIVRDGTLKAFFNVCRHKAARVMAEGAGVCEKLRCQYHGWTYDLSGRLRGTPEWNGVLDFAREAHGLPPLSVEEFGPFVFVRIKAGEPLTTVLAPFIDRSEVLKLDTLHFVERRSYDLKCNWKVFVDNYLDGGYHVNTVHEALAGMLDYSGYTTECFGASSLQSSPLRGGNEVRQGDRAYYWWLWPNTMMNIYDGMMDTNIVEPITPTTCRVHIDFYFSRNAPDVAKSIALAHEIQLEDIAVSEAVQVGLQSQSYDTGRFSLREIGDYHFQTLLRDALSLR
jgi:choline monooxygenase